LTPFESGGGTIKAVTVTVVAVFMIIIGGVAEGVPTVGVVAEGRGVVACGAD
jgi:hypothetical protein